jgi:PAS domain S-box-containing protein
LQVEATLKERYLDLFENANDMVFTHDLSGRITSMNKAGERLLQCSRESVISRNLVDLIAEDQKAVARQWLEQVVKGNDLPTGEWDFINAVGNRVKLEISSRLIEQNGRSVEVEGVARDITERRRLERELLEISNREQRRIGHDLHDGVCQQLASIAYLVDILGDKLGEKNAAESVDAEKIGSLINTATMQARSVARGLFPVRLEENGLDSAIEEFAAGTSNWFKIKCDFICDCVLPAVDNEVALHIYYIAQEATLNAIRHGKASSVKITLVPQDSHYKITIQDNGCGFKDLGASVTGMGIRIMRYRAKVIGANLDLQSQPGHGSLLSCVFNPKSRDHIPKS